MPFALLGHPIPYDPNIHPNTPPMHASSMIGLLSQNQTQMAPLPMTGMPPKSKSNQSWNSQQVQVETSPRLVKSQLTNTESDAAGPAKHSGPAPQRKVLLNPASSSFFKESITFMPPQAQDLQIGEPHKLDELGFVETRTQTNGKKRKASDFRSPQVEMVSDAHCPSQGFGNQDKTKSKPTNARKGSQKATTHQDYDVPIDDRLSKEGRSGQKQKQGSNLRSPQQQQQTKRTPGLGGGTSQGPNQMTKELSPPLALNDPSNFPKISDVQDEEKPSDLQKHHDQVKKPKSNKTGKK